MTEAARSRGKWRLTPEHAAGGLIKGAERTMKMAGDGMLREAPRVTRFVAKRIPGAPGLVYDAATYATAKDKDRKLAGIAGSLIGGAIGGGLGMAAGPGAVVASPAGAAAGAALGESAAEALYDNRLKIADWMKLRTATLGQDLSRDLQRYAPTERLRAAALRR